MQVDNGEGPIEDSIDHTEINTARKLYSKIGWIKFFQVILIVAIVLPIIPQNLAQKFVIDTNPITNALMWHSLIIVGLFVLMALVITYEKRIMNVNLLSTYYLVAIIGNITELIEKPTTAKETIREANEFIGTLKSLLSTQIPNLEKISCVVENIGAGAIGPLLTLHKNIPEIYNGSSRDQLKSIRGSFRDLLTFFRKNDFNYLLNATDGFKEYRSQIEQKIQKRKICRKLFERLKKSYGNLPTLIKIFIDIGLFLPLCFIIVMSLVKVLNIMYLVHVSGGSIITMTITLAVLIWQLRESRYKKEALPQK